MIGLLLKFANGLSPLATLCTSFVSDKGGLLVPDPHGNVEENILYTNVESVEATHLYNSEVEDWLDQALTNDYSLSGDYTCRIQRYRDSSSDLAKGGSHE